jgi:hypothetical protein
MAVDKSARDAVANRAMMVAISQSPMGLLSISGLAVMTCRDAADHGIVGMVSKDSRTKTDRFPVVWSFGVVPCILDHHSGHPQQELQCWVCRIG